MSDKANSHNLTPLFNSTDQTTKKITLADLQSQPTKNSHQNYVKKLEYSAFSTAAGKQKQKQPSPSQQRDQQQLHGEQKQQQQKYSAHQLRFHSAGDSSLHTYDHSGFRKQGELAVTGTPLEKYKFALTNYQKQFSKANQDRPKFKQTIFQTPNFSSSISAQTQPQFQSYTKTNQQPKPMKQKQKQNKNSMNNFKRQQYQSKTHCKQDKSKDVLMWASASKMETAEIVRNLFGEYRTDYNFQYRKKKFFENFGKQI